MKTLTTLIGDLLLLAGGITLIAAISFFAAYRDAGGFFLVMGGLACLFSASCLFIGIRHLIRKDKGSAYEVITVAGIVLWLILGGRVMEMVRVSKNPSWQFAAFVLTAVVCIFVTKTLKNLVGHRWNEGEGTRRKNFTAAGAKQRPPQANRGNGSG